MPRASTASPGHIREARKLLALSQAQFAARLGVSVLTISRWENGHTVPTPRIVDVIASLVSRAPALDAHPVPSAPPGGIVGRDAELSAASAELARSRLLTITGPPGVGKTRLASELLRRGVHRFPGGTWLVNFSGLAPEELSHTVARAVGAMAGSEAGIVEALSTALDGRHGLMIFDSCEVVASRAGALAETLLGSCPGLAIVATSLQPLHAARGRTLPLQPLGLPPDESATPGQILASDSARLLVMRLRERRPDRVLSAGDVVALGSICRALDGLPLALELAAARATHMSLADVNSRLHQRFSLLVWGIPAGGPRHRSLHAAIDWSYHLLEPGAQRVFRYLGAFSRGFELDTVEAVTGIGQAGRIVADLCEMSLVTYEPAGDVGRYRLLDSFQAFALEQLTECGEVSEAKRRHSEFYAALAGGLAPDQLDARLVREPNNWLSALETIRENGDWRLLARMVGSVRALMYHGQATAILGLLDDDAPVPDGMSAEDHVRAAINWAAIVLMISDFRRAERLLASVAAVLEALPLGALRAEAFLSRGLVSYYRGNYGAAERQLRNSLSAANAAGAPVTAGIAATNLGLALFAQGRAEAGFAQVDYAKDLLRGSAPARQLVFAYVAEGDIALGTGDSPAALKCFKEALRLVPNPEAEPYARGLTLGRLALAYSELDDDIAALTNVAEAFPLIRSDGTAVTAIAAAFIRAACATLPDEAARVLGSLEAALDAGGLVAPPVFAKRLRFARERLEQAIDPDERAVLFARGRRTPLDLALYQGIRSANPAVPARALDAPAVLSNREREVLVAVSTGSTNREVATSLGISVRTVERHLSNIYARAGVRTRAGAVGKLGPLIG